MPAQPHIAVDSEIGPLRSVLVHRPGDEIVRMTQHDLELALFDDILSPPETQREHDTMVEIIEGMGAQAFDILDLLRAALERAPSEARRDLLVRLCETAGAPTLPDPLMDWAPDRLAGALIAGIGWAEVEATMTLGRIRDRVDSPGRMAMRPVPNLMFMRDPCMSVYDGLLIGRMATPARMREPMLVSFAVEHSGVIASPRLLFRPDDTHRHPSFRALEGGDFMVLSREVILIGCSARTSAPTIERAAREALFPNYPELQRVYAVMMPEARSVMHLDTILTQVDRKLFLGHGPLIAGGGATQKVCPVARIERDQPPALLEGASVLDVLREELGPDTQLVPCGGDDPLHQEREQWTDGANAICLTPGHIILYARNVHTIAALADHGFGEVRVHVVQTAAERAERIREGNAAARTVFSFTGSELSRARGGGRCLTMPIERDPL